MQNFVAKHDHNKGGAHKCKKRTSKLSKRKQKHKGKYKGSQDGSPFLLTRC